MKKSVFCFIISWAALLGGGSAEAQNCVTGEIEAFGSQSPPFKAGKFFEASNPAHPKIIANLANALNVGLSCEAANEIKALVAKSQQSPQESVVFDDVPYTADDFVLLKKKQIGEMTGEEFQAIQKNDYSQLKKKVQRIVNTTPEIGEARKRLGSLIVDRLKKADPSVRVSAEGWNGSAILGDVIKFGWEAGCNGTLQTSGCAGIVMLTLDPSMGSYVPLVKKTPPFDPGDLFNNWPRNPKIPFPPPTNPRPLPLPEPGPWDPRTQEMQQMQQMQQMIDTLQENGFTVTQ
jgi:hypothetical protein